MRWKISGKKPTDSRVPRDTTYRMNAKRERRGKNVPTMTESPYRRLQTHRHGRECAKTPKWKRAGSISHDDHAGSDVSPRLPSQLSLVLWTYCMCPSALNRLNVCFSANRLTPKPPAQSRKVGKQKRTSRPFVLHTPSPAPPPPTRFSSREEMIVNSHANTQDKGKRSRCTEKTRT